MKYIKTFEDFLNEALKDEIPSHLSDILSKRYDKKYLDMDVPKHTDIIPNIKIKIDDKYSKEIINNIKFYFKINIIEQFESSKIYQIIRDNYKIISKSLNSSDNFKLSELNDLKKLYSKNFRLLQSKDNDI